MKSNRSSSPVLVAVFAVAAVALTVGGCAQPSKNPADALMYCPKPDQTCKLVLDNGDESACRRVSSGALVCSSVARAD